MSIFYGYVIALGDYGARLFCRVYLESCFDDIRSPQDVVARIEFYDQRTLVFAQFGLIYRFEIVLIVARVGNYVDGLPTVGVVRIFDLER